MSEKKIHSKADLLTYKALQKAVEQNKLRIYMDYGRINRPQSPIYNPWESLLPILIPVFIGLLLILYVGVIFGLFFITAMILVYSAYFKKKLYHKVIEKTKAYITSNYECCEKLWNFGGVVFVNADNKKIGCVSPEGDWKEFVVLNYAEFMVDTPKEQDKQQEAHVENAQNSAAV